MSGEKKLSFGSKLKYGVGDFGVSTVGALIQFFTLFYYTDVVHINPGLAGTAMLVGKLTWDMVNDVLFGYIGDRTQSRWGRRRPYLIFCAVPMISPKSLHRMPLISSSKNAGSTDPER